MPPPLKVALVHRDSPRLMAGRMVGWWSYPTPEFVWEHIPVPRSFILDKDELARQFDLVFYEDGKIGGRFYGSASIPIVYMVVDSTLSEAHYQHRLKQAEQCDLVLVDWDRLERFSEIGRPVHRFLYCVNDHLFCDYNLERDIEVGSFQGGTAEREAMEVWLKEFCRQGGYRLEKGIYKGQAYARMMARCKIVINLNRTPLTRGHRVFDAMALASCLLTSPLAEVSGEVRQAGRHYVEFDSLEALGAKIVSLLETGRWTQIGRAGYELVQAEYTWARRSAQLRQLLETWLGL